MKSEIEFEEWMKFDLRIGEVLEINKGKIKINLGNKILEIDKKLKVEKGDKIVVGIQGEELIFPLIDNSVIVPEKEIENGSRVG